jgi:dephospho-CoA kinase
VVVGLTGGIGCGKSEVGRILAERGVAVFEADECAHAALEPGGAAYTSVRRHFGDAIVDGEGRIDRSALGAIVFDDPEALATLNALVHPPVRAAWREWIERQRNEGRDAAVIIPLLFEIGATEGWDAVVCVSAPRDVVMERLAGRGWSRAETTRRIESQWPLEKKRRRSDYVIENAGSFQDLRDETQDVWKRIVSEGETGHDD